ncbi:uncharacterized protein LOC128858780 [Anastrepha ludens]|uniref:uncharacterized protein LOC128858780 n=1 Tax=Anastrepha ludens TaxID=28586 RepID=UPI0023AFFB19|nr:uncharacterized protein LOC128858780 [Anastrepha ludens]
MARINICLYLLIGVILCLNQVQAHRITQIQDQIPLINLSMIQMLILQTLMMHKMIWLPEIPSSLADRLRGKYHEGGRIFSGILNSILNFPQLARYWFKAFHA